MPVQTTRGSMTITEQELYQVLMHYITTELNPALSGTLIGPDDLLIESGIVDSLGLFKLITFVEEQFDVLIDPDEIVLST